MLPERSSDILLTKKADETAAIHEREAAFNQMYAACAQKLLYRVSRLARGDKELAEDVVQEAFIRAWKNIDTLQSGNPSTWQPWLVTVSRRILIDLYRARKRRPVTVRSDLGTEVSESSLDEMELVIDSMVISDCLKKLSAGHRAAVVETYINGRAAVEAASILGIHPGTIRSRVFYSLRKIRQELLIE